MHCARYWRKRPPTPILLASGYGEFNREARRWRGWGCQVNRPCRIQQATEPRPPKEQPNGCLEGKAEAQMTPTQRASHRVRPERDTGSIASLTPVTMGSSGVYEEWFVTNEIQKSQGSFSPKVLSVQMLSSVKPVRRGRPGVWLSPVSPDIFSGGTKGNPLAQGQSRQPEGQSRQEPGLLDGWPPDTSEDRVGVWPAPAQADGALAEVNEATEAGAGDKEEPRSPKTVFPRGRDQVAPLQPQGTPSPPASRIPAPLARGSRKLAHLAPRSLRSLRSPHPPGEGGRTPGDPLSPGRGAARRVLTLRSPGQLQSNYGPPQMTVPPGPESGNTQRALPGVGRGSRREFAW
uniref:Uncharacterized protein n=1 Tax=Rangifer tarandus platyrhynchus TaxID=3082113 RepID=A0ACB0DTR5_RANTA|nr:unnamed protein product [Rangifer tarandus platyrhynchus]